MVHAVGMPDDARALAERLDDAPPRVRLLMARALLLWLVLAVTTPAEWLVPVVRTAAGRRGVHLGPPLTFLLVAGAALEALSRSGPDPEEAEPPVRSGGPPRPRRRAFRTDAELAVAAAVPAATALVPGLVVLPRRSPLWGWAVSAAARLAVIVVLVLDMRRETREAASGPGT